MIAVIFEAWLVEGERDHYLGLAAFLKPKLDSIDGFISIERFESLAEPGKLLSLSFWRDEAAISSWRNGKEHRSTQAKGQSVVFSNYRLRVAQTVRDYGANDRTEAPEDSRLALGA